MFDINQIVFDEEYDETRVTAFIEELDEAFADSPEGIAFNQKYPNVSCLSPFLGYFFSYCGNDLMTMSGGDVDELLFDLFPRKVSTPPESAPEIIAELRAFFAFLDRQYRHPSAKSILAMLTVHAEQRLAKRLGDPANFGMAKSFFALGAQSGFDMSTEAGLQAFTAAYNAGLLGESPALPQGGDFDDDDDDDDEIEVFPAEPVDPKLRAQQAKRRKARKAQRQARRKNRRK